MTDKLLTENLHMEEVGFLAQEVMVKRDTLNSLIERTKRESDEFEVFILRNGDQERIVEVGIRLGDAVGTSAESIVAQLRPIIDDGYIVVADYHNHPSKSMKDYVDAGFPPFYALSPSLGDLQMDVPDAIVAQLGQKLYPRIISLFFPDEGRVELSAIVVNRQPAFSEIRLIEFENPNFEPTPDDGLVQIVGEEYGNPAEMVKRGIIRPIVIRASKPGGSFDTIENPFKGLVV